MDTVQPYILTESVQRQTLLALHLTFGRLANIGGAALHFSSVKLVRHRDYSCSLIRETVCGGGTDTVSITLDLHNIGGDALHFSSVELVRHRDYSCSLIRETVCGGGTDTFSTALDLRKTRQHWRGCLTLL
ncbi:hypothetical protein J6590_034522 [Homalodisca vitripennis]|nr:hypothetical protein J6590_034522 [Homalodisca vitripennis]